MHDCDGRKPFLMSIRDGLFTVPDFDHSTSEPSSAIRSQIHDHAFIMGASRQKVRVYSSLPVSLPQLVLEAKGESSWGLEHGLHL